MHRPAGSATGPRRPRGHGRGGQRFAGLPYAVAVCGVLSGLLWVWLSKTQVKGGMLIVAASLLLAGVARLMLADERAGLLVSRRRAIDVTAFAILGIGLLAAALLIKTQ